MEQIWFKNINNLINEKNYNKFFPSKDMNFIEQLNTCVRLSLYFSIVVFILKKDSAIFMIPICVGLFTFFLYNVDTENKTTERMFLESKSLYKDPNTNEICTQPTENNPFMNVLMSDYALNPERRKACNVSKKNIKKEANKFFDRKLYKSVGDIFNKESSQREFVTNPITTIPNAQDDFSEFLYGDMIKNKTCKEGSGNRCVQNNYREIKT